MNSLVVFDSRGGYTEALARAIGGALEGAMSVTVARVGSPESRDLTDVALLVVGGPTEAHGATPAMREWLASLGRSTLGTVHAAAFDTRLHWPRLLSGSAADVIAQHLREAGCQMIGSPESFFVEGRVSPGPDADALDLARGWANSLVAAVPLPV